MVSVDVDPLFSNIPLEETIKFFISATYNGCNVFEGTHKLEIKELFIIFNLQRIFFLVRFSKSEKMNL